MREDCKEFVNNFIHCLTGKGNIKIPRPISTTLHATRPNESIHFDYVYMGAGLDKRKYILVIKDDLSSYVWLVPTIKADAESAAVALAQWIRKFTVMDYWISDQGSHFKNKILEMLSTNHKIKHNFTIAYSTWINGTVERLMKPIQSCY